MDRNIINNIKMLGIDMINEAKSGHPGIVLGAAPIIYTLYAKHININVNDPNWINRDRFVMAAGHGSALLYSTLFMAGYPLTLDDLKRFRRIGSKTPGHPEISTIGVDVDTGPIGQGIANAVGMAIAGKKLNQKHKFSSNKQEKSLIDYNVYALCGDGELMEGISYEACSLAGSLKLDNLIVLYDSNNISLDGKTKNVFDEDIPLRFKAMNWDVEVVKDGDNVLAIDKAIIKAKLNKKPTLIQITTIIGKDSSIQGTSEVHGSPLSKGDTLMLKRMYGFPDEEFFVNEEYKNSFSRMISSRGTKKFQDWNSNYIEYEKVVRKSTLLNPKETLDLSDLRFEENLKEQARITNGRIMEEIAALIPDFIGGSADLSSSTKTYINEGNIISTDFSKKNILFGVREHAMGAIANGLALTGYRPFVSTFLVFADYMKPAIRMSALMNLPVNYVFTHDSVNIGQDGPTHQPVEQLAMLRSTPNLKVFRPCDANEMVGSWEYMLNTLGPKAIILSRYDVGLLKTTDIKATIRGGYIVREALTKLDGVIIATGSEVGTSVLIANQLFEQKQLDIRVISMPCLELFNEQSKEYKEAILPKGIKTIVIEAGSRFGWESFVYDSKYLITIDNFGVSGTKDEALTQLNFNHEQIKGRIEELLK